MAKNKHTNPLKVVILITVVLAAVAVGCFAVNSYLTAQQSRDLRAAQEAAEERNQLLQDDYAAAMAEYQRKLAEREGASETWPTPEPEGWDVVDLSNYALENASTVTMTRQEAMYNGMLLVNEWHSRPDDFSEASLVSVSNYSGRKIGVKNSSIRLFPAAAEALLQLVNNAKEQGYENFVCYDAYRSYDEQNELFQAEMARNEDRYQGDALIARAKRAVNYPGTSAYNGGMTFRVILYKSGDKTVNDKVFFACDEGLWFLEHCWEYGIVFRFPLADYPVKGTADKSYKTGVSAQLQTFSYVGKGNAAVMHALDLCMEEYIEYLAAHPHIAVFKDGSLRYEISREYVGDAEFFPVTVVGNGNVKSYTTSLDNMGYAITVFEY